MFTLRHVEENGHESIRTAKWVFWDPGVGISSSGEQGLTYGTEYRKGGSESGKFGNGTVFVMNESGKTIARYNIQSNIAQEPNLLTHRLGWDRGKWIAIDSTVYDQMFYSKEDAEEECRVRNSIRYGIVAFRNGNQDGYCVIDRLRNLGTFYTNEAEAMGVCKALNDLTDRRIG